MWSARPFSIRTPLRVPAAIAALDADRATAWTALGLSTRGAGLRHVTGSVHPDGVRLTSRRPGRSNPFRPVLQARITPLADGCELTGSFAPPLPAQWFAALWLALAVVLPLTGLAATGGRAGLAPLALGLGLAALGLAAVMTAARSGLRDEEHLRTWIQRRLTAA
jgi:hypothetical protein